MEIPEALLNWQENIEKDDFHLDDLIFTALNASGRPPQHCELPAMMRSLYEKLFGSKIDEYSVEGQLIDCCLFSAYESGQAELAERLGVSFESVCEVLLQRPKVGPEDFLEKCREFDRENQKT